MATYKTLQESALSPKISHLHCDICGSNNVAETREGYTCRDCSIVLEIQKLQYDRPYDQGLIQYAKGVGKTQIGTWRERITSPFSIKYKRMKRYNSITPNNDAAIEKARIEISRIFGCLNLMGYDGDREFIVDKFRKVFPEIRPGSKYRNIEKLVTIIIYFCLKLRNVSINPYELIEVSKISKKDFNDFNLQIRKFLPEYNERNRQEYILQRILEISEHFKLGVPFYLLSKKILFRLWQGIKNTTDNVVAGLVTSVAVLCTCKGTVSISALCSKLGIQPSTIQSQVEKNIFKRFRVKGFTTCVKSSGILTMIITKLGLLEVQESELEVVQEVVESDEHVELVFGNATKIFNNHNNKSYYFFGVRGKHKVPLIITLQVNEDLIGIKDPQHFKSHCNELMSFQVYRYYREKDPPSSSP
ncbi:MAG: hypothetical protein HWN81_02870 [Candidatus Lokiarchaeota archaeon]|nr:hypothetical protein [Candidatus Lokiarchaeota archaeon]